MHRFLSNNRHAKHIQHYILHCSIGDWFVLYQMNKQMNKRFFSEFLALVSIKVNPDPYLRADPEVDIMKTEDDNLPNGAAFYDEDALSKKSNTNMYHYPSLRMTTYLNAISQYVCTGHV